MNDRIEELLYKSLDQSLEKSEQTILEKALSDSESLQLKLYDLKQMRKTLASLSAGDLNNTIIESTLQLTRQDDFTRSLTVQFKRLMIAASLLIALFSIIEFTVVDGNSYQDALGENSFIELLSDNIVNTAYGENL